MQSTVPQKSIYSDFGDDPDLAELVKMFVDELPTRISEIREQAAQNQWAAVRRCAHQLKGAGGSYGFSAVSTFSAALEGACDAAQPEAVILRTIDELAELCSRVRAGAAR